MDASTLMKQAWMTSHDWLIKARSAVDDMDISDESAKAIIIAAFLQAAAQDQHTLTIRTLAEEGLLKCHQGNSEGCDI